MNFYSDILKEGKISEHESVIAVGNFDGVHVGHQSILNKLSEYKNYKKVIITFKPHPVIFVNPSKNFELIVADYADKVDILKNFNPDYIFLQNFSKKIKNAEPIDFVKILKEKLNMKCLIVGDDYNFGKNRAGNVDFLKSISKEYDFELVVVPQIEEQNNRITSSHIRKLLLSGDIETANRYLYNVFFIKGFVETGASRGRTLGFPTINFKSYSLNQAYPNDGIYTTLTKIDGDPKLYKSVTNIGMSPTFDEKERRVETHILDFDKNVYFKKVKIHFLHKLRDEIKFNSINELVAQITIDKEHTIKYFNEVDISKFNIKK
jgi:riboflavin kinase/FMN adenylyltransferase